MYSGHILCHLQLLPHTPTFLSTQLQVLPPSLFLKQTKANKTKILNQTKTSNAKKKKETMESTLCWSSVPCHGAFPEVWLIN